MNAVKLDWKESHLENEAERNSQSGSKTFRLLICESMNARIYLKSTFSS
jgi:hypothetical protein